jgi:hypothetical protein
LLGAEMAGEDEGTPVSVRPSIADPFGGPGADPFADPLA